MGSSAAGERQRTSAASLESILPESDELRLRWLANILNSIYDGLVVVDAEARILYANPAYSRLIGVPVSSTPFGSGVFRETALLEALVCA